MVELVEVDVIDMAAAGGAPRGPTDKQALKKLSRLRFTSPVQPPKSRLGLRSAHSLRHRSIPGHSIAAVTVLKEQPVATAGGKWP